jgi:hypothetical protein
LTDPRAERPSVYVDLDDVLCETARMLAGLALREFGQAVRFEHIRDFNLMESFSLNVEQYGHLMALAHAPDVLAALDAVPGATEAVRGWIQRGTPVTVVTGRPPSAAAATRAWLQRHGLERPELVFVDKYGRHADSVARGECMTLPQIVGRRRFRLAVEDEPRTAGFLLKSLDAPVALLERPWNEGAALPRAGGRRIVRCRDWAEIVARWPEG